MAEKSVFDLLTEDHRAVDDLFKQIEALEPSAAEQRRDLTDTAAMELLVHTVAEEKFVYPQLAEQDEKEAQRARNDHQQVESALEKLAELQADSSEFEEELGSLIADVREHISEEEGPMFDELRRGCSEADLVTMANYVSRFKELVPDDPAPSGPEGLRIRPVGSVLERLREVGTTLAETDSGRLWG